MALIVEDGSGLEDANSYISVLDADEYHDTRGNTAWEDGTTDLEREAALIRATTYIDNKYGPKFTGTRLLGREQALEWPRDRAYDRELILLEDVPIEVQHATAEAALREIVSPGSLMPDVKEAARKIEQTVGPITTRYSDRMSALSAQTPQIGVVEGLMSRLIGSTGMTRFVERS